MNISGSRGKDWAGPHPDNLTPATFDLIVETVRKIIDAVKPSRTFYTLETMQWMYPDSTAAYLRLLKAIDRPAFAAHFDPTNLVTSPQIYFNTGAMIKDALAKLGPLYPLLPRQGRALGAGIFISTWMKPGWDSAIWITARSSGS